jgi:hypothetical protein
MVILGQYRSSLMFSLPPMWQLFHLIARVRRGIRGGSPNNCNINQVLGEESNAIYKFFCGSVCLQFHLTFDHPLG